MANTIVLRSRALPNTYHHNQFHNTISSSPQNLFLRHPPYKTCAASITLFLQKSYNNNINPTVLLSNKPFIINQHETNTPDFSNPELEHNINNEQEKTSPKNPLGLILDAITSAIKCLSKPAAAAVLVCLLMIIHDRRYPAWAASGGRMGGDSFSSWSSSSHSPSSGSGSSWRSSWDSDSYYWSSGSDRPRWRSSWDSDSYYWSSGSDRPRWRSSSSIDYAQLYALREEENEANRRELVYAFASFSALVAFVAVYEYLMVRARIGSSAALEDQIVTARESNSIIKLQIGVLGTARSLQSELNKIPLTADTSTSKGISYVLTETIRALLQHNEYFTSAYSSVNPKRRIWDGRNLFKQLSLEERAKFDEETLVNVNNIKKHIKNSPETTGISSDLIVITLLVAVRGELKLPTIKGSVELKEALQKLGSIPYYDTIAAEVLWTPQDENDTLSEEELTKDYPLLRPLEDDLQT